MVEDQKTLDEIRYIGKLLFMIRFYPGICGAVHPVINQPNILLIQLSALLYSSTDSTTPQKYAHADQFGVQSSAYAGRETYFPAGPGDGCDDQCKRNER
jgi:hypothetical protein